MDTSETFFKLADFFGEDAPRHARIATDSKYAYIWEIQVHDPAETLLPEVQFSTTKAIPWPTGLVWTDLDPWSYRASAVRIPATAGVAALQAAWDTVCNAADPFAHISPERILAMRSAGMWV